MCSSRSIHMQRSRPYSNIPEYHRLCLSTLPLYFQFTEEMLPGSQSYLKMIKKRNVRRRRQFGLRGQGLSEFALVAPVAMIVLFCVVQAGQMIYAYSFVSYAARLGARYAAVHGSDSSSPFTSSAVTSYIQGLSSGLKTSSLSATATSTPNNSPGSTANVTVTYTYQPIRPFSQTTISLSSTAQTTISY